MAANVNKLKTCIAQLDYKFDVIAILETWMNDNESEECIDSCTEVTCAEITTSNGKNIIVASIYRTPNTDLTLLNELIEYVSQL